MSRARANFFFQTSIVKGEILLESTFVPRARAHTSSISRVFQLQVLPATICKRTRTTRRTVELSGGRARIFGDIYTGS